METLPWDIRTPQNGTQVRELEFNTTNLVDGVYHPIHLHGCIFYRKFDRERDPLNYNFVDPHLQNKIAVPQNGWTAIEFKANYPGVWLMHCHLENHAGWGMEMAFIAKNGKRPDSKMLPPHTDKPRC